MSKVSVLDTNKNILAPCHPARAKELLDKGKAAVYRRYPFTIIEFATKPRLFRGGDVVAIHLKSEERRAKSGGPYALCSMPYALIKTAI